MTESVLMQSVSITVIGMSIVLLFLVILIGLMKAMSALVQVLEVYFPQTTAKPAAQADTVGVAIAIAAAKRFQNN